MNTQDILYSEIKNDVIAEVIPQIHDAIETIVEWNHNNGKTLSSEEVLKMKDYFTDLLEHQLTVL